jgi:hypothetical protein
LTGALVPLVGAAPSSVNFVTADYNRTTGLKGDGSTKYLASNRNNNADPQDNQHMALWVTEAHGAATRGYMGVGQATSGASAILTEAIGANRVSYRSRNSNLIGDANGTAFSTGFIGLSRSNSAEYITRIDGANTTRTQARQTPLNADITIFGRSNAAQSTARIATYSIGESLDLALLDARIATYMASLT